MRRVGVALIAMLGSCQSGEPKPSADLPLLDGRDLATARAIEFLGGRDGQPYRLERQARGGWRLTQPIRDDLAPAPFASLAQAFGRARLLALSAAPAVTGLDAPVAHLNAEFDTTTLRIEFGKADSRADSAGRIWVRRDTVTGTVTVELLAPLQPEQAALRSRAVFPLPNADSVRIERDGRSIVEVARAGTAWRGQLPANRAPADLAAAVLGLQVAEHRYGPPIDRGTPSAQVVVVDAHGTEQLTLWRDGPRWVGHQAHRDVEFWLELPAQLAELVPE
jgi:hypothetical protein